MPAKDKFHNQVKEALIKEGWIITHDPYSMKIGRKGSQIDLGAKMPIGAEKEGRKIAVEIKSFLGNSALDDLEDALGQYGIYDAILQLREPERILYLAVPNNIRAMLLDEADYRHILRKFQARIIFYDRKGKEELEWIEQANIAP